jgi:hypothetical protein
MNHKQMLRERERESYRDELEKSEWLVCEKVCLEGGDFFNLFSFLFLSNFLSVSSHPNREDSFLTFYIGVLIHCRFG